MVSILVTRVVGAAWFRRLFRWWGARSLAVSAISYGFDITTLLTCVKLLRLPAPLGAMAGVCVGWSMTFFLNRRFAFRQHGAPIGPQALRFAATAACAMVVHGTLVGILVNHWHLPVVVAKVSIDLSVFSVGLPLLLRYVVFPVRRSKPSVAPVQPPEGVS